MILIKHFPVLQVLSPLFGALFSILTFRYIFITRIIVILSIGLSLILSIYGLSAINAPLMYNFGNWAAPIGIEYKLDYLSQPLIIYINGVILFYLIFCNKLIKETVLEFIDKKRRSLFYAILLFAHAGYLGILSTNDLFNLYVFIEISSLSTYVLMAQGNNPKAAIGAFDYLILGTIGATLILIAIGFLLSYTGSLNMTDISGLLKSNYHSKTIVISISFFLIGALLKTALFPMHFWMIRAYYSVAPVMLIYITGISSIVGIYIVLRFIHCVIDYNVIINIFPYFIKPIALSAITLCTYFALKGQKIKNIIIYSATAQIGYVFLLLGIPQGENIIFPFLLADSLNKIALFLIITISDLYGYAHLKKVGLLWRFLVGFNLICSCGLPISGMFIIKLTIIELLLLKKLWVEFIVIIISSCLAYLYHYKIAKKLFFEENRPLELRKSSNVSKYISDSIPSSLNHYGLTIISIGQAILVIYLGRLQIFYNMVVNNTLLGLGG
ncbi:proton-conducting transporter membrane subunit [Candidatus Tisiphia endosymbiont of Beris chalybata]|uniref:proton-conducting transporter transmembrane domain-containing protein n=1 Tax=Candidatus Tisiphia endosymbiont of Beris chalybata TaxID=3066262 RepID=UPI00312C8873